MLVVALAALGVLLADVLPHLSRGEASGWDPAEDDTLVIRFGDPEGRGEVHVVREGESLSSIAQQRLGDPTLAGELARINGLRDPDELAVGQVLYLR